MPRATNAVKRKRLQGEQRREAIINAALELFVTKGYASVSVDEIVRKAGGSKSAVYQLFGSKKKLLAAVTEELAERMLSEMEAPEVAGGDIREALRTVGLKLIRLILSDSAILQYRLAITNLTVDPRLSHMWYTRGPATTFLGFARLIEKEAAAGRLRVRNCQRAADFFLGMLMCKHNIAMSAGERAPSAKEMRAIVSDAVDVFLAAYGV